MVSKNPAELPDSSIFDKLSQKGRVPLVVFSFSLLMYFAIYFVAFVPPIGFNYAWNPDNVMRIMEWVTEPSGDLQPNDIVLEINGRPAKWTVWSSLFPSRFLSENEKLEFTIQREGQILDVDITTESYEFSFFQRRLPVVLTALFVWVIGAIVIFFATPQNRDGWEMGLTRMFAAIIVVATEAALHGVPGAWLSTPLLPLVAVMWVHVALLPHIDGVSHHEKVIFRGLYIAAGLVGCVFLFEILFITPAGSGISIETLTRVSSYTVALFCVMLGLLCHLLLLIWRFVKIPASYQYHRQQIRVILVFAALAYLPPILLTFLPNVVFNAPLLPWLLAFPLLALGPAGYAFVIFRRNYLDLDIVTTQTLSSLLAALFLLSVFSAIFYFVQPDLAVIVLGAMLLASPKQKARSLTDAIVYGENKAYDSTDITSNLSANPQMTTLRKTVQDISGLLQVRYIVLMLVDRNESMVPVAQTDSEFIDSLPIQELEQNFDLNSPLIVVTESTYSFLENASWVNYIVPLVVGGDIIGSLFIGRPVPDGYLNAEQASFVRQIANVMAVTVEAIQRYDASRLMSRKLLVDRYETRLSLANRIHNEPLRRISSLRNAILHSSKNHDDVNNRPFMRLEAWEQTLDLVATQLRDICANLHPPVFDQGPKWAVREVVTKFREEFNLEIHLSITVSNELKTPRKITKAFYNILTEALNNVHKHADAKDVWVSLEMDNPNLVLIIRDNGKADSLKSLSLVDPIHNHHFGVAGMYEEADLVNSHLVIDCHPDGGLVVNFRVPLTQDALSLLQMDTEFY